MHSVHCKRSLLSEMDSFNNQGLKWGGTWRRLRFVNSTKRHLPGHWLAGRLKLVPCECRLALSNLNCTLKGNKCCRSLLNAWSQFCILQINNHRLGTIVQKFSGSVADGVVDSFEPAFAYHQLQQVCLNLPENSDLVRRQALTQQVHCSALTLWISKKR